MSITLTTKQKATLSAALSAAVMSALAVVLKEYPDWLPLLGLVAAALHITPTWGTKQAIETKVRNKVQQKLDFLPRDMPSIVDEDTKS